MDIKREFQFVMEKFKVHHQADMFKEKEAYACWLAQTYFFVKHSTALLGYSLPFLKDMKLRHHFEHHLGEETKHDLVILKDLQKLGKTPAEFDEFPMTQAFYQSQYYRIAFEGGTSLLGYILLLEGLAVHWGGDVYRDVKDRYKGSALFLKVHAEEDPAHLEGALQTILSLSQQEQEFILRNFHYSAEIYTEIVGLCVARSRVKKAA